MGLLEETTHPPKRQDRPTLRANPKQRAALAKRGIEVPTPAPPPAATTLKHRLKHLTKQRDARRAAIHYRDCKTRDVLAKRFPHCIRKFRKPKLPLKIGITADIINACPDLNPNDIANAVADYCSGASYHAAMIEGASRVDLDGNAAGIVTKRDADRAADILKKLQKEIVG
jgi:hypothetical protein